MVLKLFQCMNVSLMNKTINTFLLICLFSFSISQIYDFSDLPNDDESFSVADFRLYVPEDIDTIKGIYAYMHGFGGDSRYIVQDSSMQALVKSIDFALMGVRLDNMHMDSGIGNSLLDAKSNFAEQANHNELNFSPLFFEGYSWGGQWSYHYTEWHHEDVIAFITMKGGYHDTTYSANAIHVPGYMFIGENDSDYRIDNLTNIFLNHRPFGAIWALAMEPNAGHNRVTDRNLLDNFLFDMIDKRLPNSFDTEQPISLLEISEDSGWLGNRTNYIISPYECYDQEIDTLSWLSNSLNAQNWQYFVSDSSVDTINNCNLGDLNFDGILNIYDILILLDIILDNSNYDESADMNYDQILNIQDILILIQEILNS